MKKGYGYVSSHAPPLKGNPATSPHVHPNAPPLKSFSSQSSLSKSSSSSPLSPSPSSTSSPSSSGRYVPPQSRAHNNNSPFYTSPSKDHNDSGYYTSPTRNYNNNNNNNNNYNNNRGGNNRESFGTVALDTIYDETVVHPPMRPFMADILLCDSANTRHWGDQKGVIEVEGDLLTSDCDVVVHCCNCLWTMGAGIALTINKLQRAMARGVRGRQENTYIKADKQKMSHYSWALTRDNFTVINMYAQFDYGRNARKLVYDALRCGMQRMVNQFAKQNVQPKIGTYWLGCSNAGGDISVVREILDQVFVDYPIFVYDNSTAPWKKGSTPRKSVNTFEVTDKLGNMKLNNPSTPSPNKASYQEDKEKQEISSITDNQQFPSLSNVNPPTSSRWADSDDDEQESTNNIINSQNNEATQVPKKKKNQHRGRKKKDNKNNNNNNDNNNNTTPDVGSNNNYQQTSPPSNTEQIQTKPAPEVEQIQSNNQQAQSQKSQRPSIQLYQPRRVRDRNDQDNDNQQKKTRSPKTIAISLVDDKD